METESSFVMDMFGRIGVDIVGMMLGDIKVGGERERGENFISAVLGMNQSAIGTSTHRRIAVRKEMEGIGTGQYISVTHLLEGEKSLVCY